MKDFETGGLETRRPERVTLSIHGDSGLLMAASFEERRFSDAPELRGVMSLVSLAMDDEQLAVINKVLGLAGACVDYAGGES